MQYTVTTIKHERSTAQIYRPILTDAERAKREKHILEALKNIYR
jgi:hypothetical protein